MTTATRKLMTADRINCLIASAFNLAAADEPSLRSAHPNGMFPAHAASLPVSVRVGWVENYLTRLHRGDLKKHEPLMYGAMDAQEALDRLQGWETPLTTNA